MRCNHGPLYCDCVLRLCTNFCVALFLSAFFEVRIKIECAFGMFVNRWGILRRAISVAITLDKAVPMVMCLTKLHNFCIDERLGNAAFNTPVSDSAPSLPNNVDPNLPVDNVEVLGNGGFGMTTTGVGPAELIGGGHHNDDTTAAVRQSFARGNRGSGPLPRERMLAQVVRKGVKRPRPRGWSSIAVANNKK